MKAYPSYSDSVSQWIGRIPTHWVKSKLKFHTSIISKGTTPTTIGRNIEHEGAVRFIKGENIHESRLKFQSEYFIDCETHQILQRSQLQNNDILFVIAGTIGKLCIISDEYLPANTSQAISFIRLKDGQKHKYFLYQLDSQNVKNQFDILVVQTAQPNLSMEDLANLELTYPPLQEQKQIVSFLDSKTQKIDKLIALTEQNIELLKEQRTALINQCVTKGLNPNVEMKDSGVEWIGEIPKHWNITKLKFIGDVVIGLSYKPENVVDEGEGTLVMRSSNVQNGKPSFSDNVYVNCEISEKLTTKEGDILICSRNGSRRLIGKNCIITKEIAGMSFGVFMTIFRSEYWGFTHWILNSPIFKSQAGLFLTSTINQLTVSTLQNFIIPFIAERAEQNQIVEYLNEQTHKIDSTIEKESQRIELLKEYRRALISEVVTGKIDVRDEVVV